MKCAGTITRIEVQKKNRKRFSIYLDDAFAFGLDISLVAKYNLKKGDLVTRDRVTEIVDNEEKRRVKEKAFTYLARRAHSEKELSTKLRHKGFPDRMIACAVDELKKEKYLDDREFATSYALSRVKSKPIGARLLRQELWQKGLAEGLIDEALAKTYAEYSQENLATRLAKQRVERFVDLEPDDKRKKIYDFLIRRGFEWQIANKVILSVDWSS